MSNATSYSPAGRERAVQLLQEHEREHESQWRAMPSIAGKIGCSAETLRSRCRPGQVCR